MIVNEVNPPWLKIERYVDFLNSGFSNDWTRSSFDWYRRRFQNGRTADIVVRAEGTRVLAGMTCCYRQMQYESDDPIDVCILSAGTTLPTERRHGHYRTLLETGLDVCRRHSCAAVLGFVTRENASGRGLLRLGARAIPSYYIVSKGSTEGSIRTARRIPTVVDVSQIEPRLQAPERSGQIRFHYTHTSDWRWQFISRPQHVAGLRMAHDSLGLVERVDRTDRLQWLGCPAAKIIGSIATAASASARAGRDFFMYTLDPLLARAACRLGLGIRPGLLMVLPLDHRAERLRSLPGTAWSVQSGDRL